jgi:hypothetical protein
MTQQHPITPPPELMEQWMQAHATKYDLARHAAQWGADQELEACCTEVAFWENTRIANLLRESRRPKPPSLGSWMELFCGDQNIENVQFLSSTSALEDD